MSEDRADKSWLLLLLAVALMAAMSSQCGCSAKAAISNAAREVDVLASGIQSDLASAKATGEVGPRAEPHIDAASQKAAGISEKSQAITAALPGVKDVETFWTRLLAWLPWILIGGAVVFVLVYFGPVLKPILAMLGIIPGVIASKAKIAADKIAASKESSRPLPVEDVRLIELDKTDPRFKKALDKQLRAKGVAT